MKASEFIKTALIDQMQIIADAGLWFHLAKLIPSGVEVLARVTERNYNDGLLLSEKNPESFAMSDYVQSIVTVFYSKYFPSEYKLVGVAYSSKEFFSYKPLVWLTSDNSGTKTHLQFIGEKEHLKMQCFFLHVPFWFNDFKSACQVVLAKIETGELNDVEVLKMGEA